MLTNAKSPRPRSFRSLSKPQDLDVVGSNAHLARVMELDDNVSAVSIHHELNVRLRVFFFSVTFVSAAVSRVGVFVCRRIAA
jgi:hypothetical protein